LIACVEHDIGYRQAAETTRQAALSLGVEAEEREEIDANYDRSPGDWPRVEDTLRRLADRLAKAGDPSASAAWLSVARATRYQSGRPDDTLSALIEALYWDRGNAHAWSELVDYASAAPHVRCCLRSSHGSRSQIGRARSISY
jgi:hypothetical protein